VSSPSTVTISSCARREGLSNAHFVQMDLFKSCLRAEVFDYVFSNGVLHHTANAFGGFHDSAGSSGPAGSS